MKWYQFYILLGLLTMAPHVSDDTARFISVLNLVMAVVMRLFVEND